jgi:serine/threonine-protein kinase
LRGRTREEAQAILVGRGLVLGQASTAPSNETPDTVIAQQPAGASRVPPGTGVNVVLAVTPVQPRPVPNVIGMTQAQAGDALRAAGFTAGSTSNVPSRSPEGSVTAQMPVAGASAQAGAAIALVLASPVDASSGLPVPLPLLWTLLGGALGVAAAATAAKVKGKATAKEPSSPPSSVTLAPQPDPNMAVTLSADGPFTRSELMLRPFVDAGVQTVQGSGRLGMLEVTEAR